MIACCSSRGERTMRMPLPPPPADGLMQHRVADALGLGQRVGVVAQHARARDRRQSVLGQQRARAGLGREALQHLRRRADEGQAVGARHLGEGVVLGQEAVARVDRIAPADEGRGQDRRRGQVAAPRLGRPDADRLVGELDGARSRGRPRCRPRPTAMPRRAARAQDAQRDLAAIGDQDLAEHQASTSWP